MSGIWIPRFPNVVITNCQFYSIGLFHHQVLFQLKFKKIMIFSNVFILKPMVQFRLLTSQFKWGLSNAGYFKAENSKKIKFNKK